MPNYAGLRPHQTMPLAALVQLALNAAGAALKVDGAYGRLSVAAMKDFQRDRRLTVDGVVGKQTWPRLMATRSVQIGDIVDGYEKKGWALETSDLRDAGAQPFVNYPRSLEQTRVIYMQMISHFKGSNLSLLRFHGHGNSGTQVIFGGTTKSERYNLLTPWLLESKEGRQIFKGLRPAMSRYGSIQLNGCSVGRGAEGRKLLRLLADVSGVPVSAGTSTQFAGGRSATFFVEGKIETQCPGGVSLKSWAQNLPRFTGYSPA